MRISDWSSDVCSSDLCFLSGLRPDAPMGTVTGLPRLVARAKSLLDANKERRTQTTTGNTRHGMQNWVYRRSDLPCHRCGTAIRTTMIGEPGRERARAEERRVGKECVSPCRSRGAP